MQNQHAPWQSYWQDSSLDTFGNSFSQGNPIADVLLAELKQITFCHKSVECVLDLGCGKGEHFSWLKGALSQTDNTSFKVIGVDAAVNSMQLQNNDMIVSDNFETLQNIKQLGADFDLVFALFAAEYGDFSKTLAAIKAIANKPLDCVFISHTDSSIITEKTHQTLEFYRLFLNKDCEKALRKLAKSHNIKQFEANVLSNISTIFQLQRNELMYDLQLVAGRLQSLFSSVNLNDKKRHVGNFLQYFEQLKMHALRLKQQLQAAGNSDNLRNVLENQGAELHCDKLIRHQQGEIGCLFHFVLLS